MAQFVNVDRLESYLDVAEHRVVGCDLAAACSSSKGHSYASLNFSGKFKNIASRQKINKSLILLFQHQSTILNRYYQQVRWLCGVGHCDQQIMKFVFIAQAVLFQCTTYGSNEIIIYQERPHAGPHQAMKYPILSAHSEETLRINCVSCYKMNHYCVIYKFNSHLCI